MTSALIAAYKGQAGADVLAFAKIWRESASRPLTVVTVYPGQTPLSMGRTDAEWVAYNREQAHELLDEARGHLGDVPDVSYRAIASESASRGLHEVMESSGQDAITIVGSRKTRGVRRTSPGSTADRLLQGAPGPVAIVPWDYEQQEVTRIERVAVAYVDTPDANAALTTGAAMAAELGAELLLYSVLPDTRVEPTLGEPARFAMAQRDAYRTAVEEAAAALPGDLQVTARVVEGPVVDTLSNIRPDEADLLVCGSRGYGPARRILLGGVSSRLLHHARVPVVVVPRG